MDIKFDSVCRICLINTSNLMNIIDEGLDQFIMTFALVKVHQDDGLPQCICETCNEELKTAIQFKEKCEKSYLKLYEYINTVTSNTQLTVNNLEYFDPKEIYEDMTICLQEENSILKDTIIAQNIEIPTLYECVLCKKQNPVPDCDSCSEVTLLFEKHSEEETAEKLIVNEIPDNETQKIIRPKRPQKKHQCDTCGKIFNCKAGLVQHLTVHTNKRPFSCKECGKSFRLKSFLSKHLLSHAGIRNHYCIYCGKSFILKSNLTKHMEVHSGEKKFICTVCDKKFKSSRSLQYHLKLHTGERNFPCSQCERAFVNKFDLRRHEQLHEKQQAIKEGTYKLEQKPKNHQCEVCGTFYPSLRDLVRHFRVHSGDKPYKCDICDKSFIGLSGLTVHIRSHTGAKPYKCQYCDQYFSQTSNLKVHLRLHTGETPYTCDFCNKGYNRKRDLSAHVKKHFVDNVE